MFITTCLKCGGPLARAELLEKYRALVAACSPASFDVWANDLAAAGRPDDARDLRALAKLTQECRDLEKQT